MFEKYWLCFFAGMAVKITVHFLADRRELKATTLDCNVCLIGWPYATAGHVV
jgi:hypothetical protein